MSQSSPSVMSPAAPAARTVPLLPRHKPEWVAKWSVPSALRALRAVLVMPALFALCYKGLGDLQMALFAGFGCFANLVMASFGGTRRDKAISHLGLAVIGSVALSIGTAVSGTTWLATIVTIPVAFGIFFAGVAGPNAAAGITAALLTYVLPVASAGTVSMIPDRLPGWWMACAASTVAVLLLSPRPAGDRLRASAAASARTLADLLDSLLQGTATPAQRDAAMTAKMNLQATFAGTPYRPTGLATADQGLGSLVQVLEWCAALIADAIDEDTDFPQDDSLVRATANALTDVAAMLDGADVTPRIEELEQACDPCGPRPGSLKAATPNPEATLAAARRAFHEQAIAVAVRALIADTLIATRRADPETVAARRRSWIGAPPEGDASERRGAAMSGAIGVLVRHASMRSVWMLNSLRGSLALAAAVLVADLSGVQHGFWVVLGTMSVLRTNAASTESTALRALGGTVIGFAVGALLLLGIGTSTPALWAAFPIALAVAAYAPGTLPFAFGQAAFTVVVVVLFNLLQPVGWKVGLLRIQDVALGCLVSLVVGVLFWPRGAGSIVGDDLADAFRRGAAYLTQAVDWALGSRHAPPDAATAAVTAGIRLDEALRGFLAEQGAKKLSKEDMWMLVMATMRLRLTAYSLAGLEAPDAAKHASHRGSAYARAALSQATADLTDFYERVAMLVGRPVPHQVLLPVTVPPFVSLEGNGSGTIVLGQADGIGGADGGGVDGASETNLVRVITAPHHPHLLWVREELQHLRSED